MPNNTLRSNLSCMFTMSSVEGIMAEVEVEAETDINYDYLAANQGKPSHRLPQLELEPAKPLPESYRDALAALAYRALLPVMTPSKVERALAAKEERISLTLDAVDATDTANRPDTIPSDLFITANGLVLGVADTAAWRKGETGNRAIHAPTFQPELAGNEPSISYCIQRKHSYTGLNGGRWATVQQDSLSRKCVLTESELQVAAWLSEPGRTVTTSKKPDRLTTLMARFWDKGEGNSGLQRVDGRNAELRSQRAA